MRTIFLSLQVFMLISFSCSSQHCENSNNVFIKGSEQSETYLPYLQGRKVALLANHTAMLNDVHLLDTLLSLKVNIVKIFSPEHGFRGTADAGENVNNSIDSITKIPIVSLYGKKQKPDSIDMAKVDAVVMDIQDVGVRFYTYTSTMHYMMEACAEWGVEFIVLDRPNPNGYYVDGPLLDMYFQSFLGMHPVPLVHGMTIGEYAQMINGEGWLKRNMKCKLKVVKCLNYSHADRVVISDKPSPNLPNMQAIRLYPSLGLFEGTVMNAGRGTDKPFQIYGHPKYSDTTFSYTPRSIPGAAKNPKCKDKKCFGVDLSSDSVIWSDTLINLSFIMDAYQNTNVQRFFNSYFTHHAGVRTLKQQIINNESEEKIRSSWNEDLEKFKLTRKKYLLYPDF